MVDVPIPETMKRLPLDKRGLPIPYVVLRDNSGEAHFTVNDASRVQEAAFRQLCHICGQRLKNTKWFVGGPLSAFHPAGAYNDGPMHDECVHYALRVCPWLAVPHYGKSITEAAAKRVNDEGVTLVDHTSMPGRPPCFVAIRVVGFEAKLVNQAGAPHLLFNPTKPYLKIEFWQHGEQLDEAVGRLIAQNSFSRSIKAQEPRVLKTGN